MGIVARFVPLLIVCLLVFTEPGQKLYGDIVDWGAERAAEWFQDTLEENEALRELRDDRRGLGPKCDSDFKPEGFEVSGSEAIALAVGGRKIDCDLVDLEPMDNQTWAVHVDAKGPNGCEFSALIDGKTGEVPDRFRDCD